MGLLGSFNGEMPQHEGEINVKLGRSVDAHVNQLIECITDWAAVGCVPYPIGPRFHRHAQIRRSAEVRFPDISPTPEVINGLCEWYHDGRNVSDYQQCQAYGHVMSVLIQKSYLAGYNDFVLHGISGYGVDGLHGTADNPITITFAGKAYHSGHWCSFANIAFASTAVESVCYVSNSTIYFEDDSPGCGGGIKRSTVVFNAVKTGMFGAESIDSQFFLNAGFDPTTKGSGGSWQDRFGKDFIADTGAPFAKNCEFYFQNSENLKHLEHPNQMRCKFYVKDGDGHKLIRRQRLHGMLNRLRYRNL